jgi:DNA (cytosine-5)-methyltransferase 1
MSHAAGNHGWGQKVLAQQGRVTYSRRVRLQSGDNKSRDVAGLGGRDAVKPRAVALFAGCGGFCEGVSLADFEIRCAVEIDRFAAETYRHNFPKTPLFEGDIADFLTDPSHFEKYQLTDIDLVFGGPPCQGYSQIGTRDLNDERNQLYREYARVVQTLRPRVFLMENVPNLLLLQKGHFRDLILKHFASIGYSNVTFVKVSAADFGVPQLRQRVFFIGTRDDAQFPFDLRSFCEGILGKLKVAQPFTVDEAINDLPAKVVASGKTLRYPKPKRLSRFQRMMRLDTDGGPYTRRIKRLRGIGRRGEIVLHNHHTKEIQARRAKLISLLEPGQKADSLPKKIWNGKRPEKWRRLHPANPSYTILAQMHRDLSEWVHPHLNRWITVREAARLQSFHDGFVFVGSEWQQLKQIGNAVPPLLAFAMAQAAGQVLRVLAGEKIANVAVQSMLPQLSFGFQPRTVDAVAV